MKKLLMIALTLLSAVFAQARSESEILARMNQITTEMKTTTDPQRLMALTSELIALTDEISALTPARPPSPPPEPVVMSVKADKFGFTEEKLTVDILKQDLFRTVRITALESDVSFANGILIVGSDPRDRIHYPISHLSENQSIEISLFREVYSRSEHKWHYEESMWVQTIQMSIETPHVFGSRGRVQIELIP